MAEKVGLENGKNDFGTTVGSEYPTFENRTFWRSVHTIRTLDLKCPVFGWYHQPRLFLLNAVGLFLTLNSFRVMSWSGIQMVGLVHRTKPIDRPFEY